MKGGLLHSVRTRLAYIQRSSDRRSLYRAFGDYAKPYRAQIVLATVAGILSLGAMTAAPSMIKAVIDHVDAIVTGRAAASTTTTIWLLGSILLLLAGIAGISNYLRRSIAIKVSLRMDAQMRNDLYAHLQRLSLSFHSNWQSGQLISRAITDLNSVRRFLGFGAIFMVTSTLTVIVVFVLLFQLDAPLAALTTVIVLPVIVLTSRFGRAYRRISRRSQNQQGDVNTLVEEVATGVRVVKSYGRQPEVIDAYRSQASTLRAINLEGVRVRASTWSTLHLLPNLAIAVITLIGGFAVIHGALSVGGLVAFTAYMAMLVQPMDLLGWVISMLEEAVTAATRVYEVFDEVPAIRDHPAAESLDTCAGRVTFDDVWFRHGGSGAHVLCGVDLELEPGETVALVGRTGSGKSSVAALIPRLIDPERGRVLLDGHDIAGLRLHDLRRHVAVVFEDPVLFSASVRENLTMGNASISEATLRTALDAVQADFVEALPWGLDTRIGEQGYTLSGGQRQRLALARAIVASPRILVLDDPLSSVDVHTEAAIEKALHQVLRDVTALVIAHRPSTVLLADRVALLDEGRIAAVGTHAELMRGNAVYRATLAGAPAEERSA